MTRNDDILELAKKNRLTRTDKFNFACKQCGNCCKNREDILLNPFDLNRLAHALKMPQQEVVQKYCSVYIGEASRLPCVCIKPIGKNKICPFLKNDGRHCFVHKEKPTVCALFPLGRGIALDEGKSVFYILQDVKCGLRNEKHTPEEWLNEFNLHESEEWFVEWSEFVGKVMPMIQKLEKQCPKGIINGFYNVILIELYFKYEQNYDAEYFEYPSFIAQFRRASTKFIGFLSSFATGV